MNGVRRPRYQGKNPRRFHEKYKELNPERYPSDVQKVLASGTTPAGRRRTSSSAIRSAD
jgi:16S rRNA (cytosine1402-N4)-methyltransferase